jgi:gliding motility-associated-like protein
LLILFKYRVITQLLLFSPAFCLAQGVGNYIINQSFGEGIANPGPQLPAGNTTYTYSTDSCTTTGTYTISNNLYRCLSTRMGRSLDHTPNSSDGYMMVFSPPGNKEMLVYKDTIKEALCPGTPYQFSAWMLNVGIPDHCSNTTIVPKFRLSVETAAGVELQSKNTGPLPYAYNMTFTPKFLYFEVNFTMPPGISQIVVKITSLEFGILPCVLPVAIDDIQFAALGPAANIEFTGANNGVMVKQICYAENRIVSFSGKVGNYYANTAVQWQQSINNGISWEDLPDATQLTYERKFSIPDTFLFRLSAADVTNIGNYNCRVISNTLKVEANGIPKGFKVTSNSPVCIGADVVFDAEEGEGLSYEWHGPNGYYDNVYYPRVNHTQLKDSGMYYVTVTTTGGCRFEDSTYVKVYGVGAVTAGNDTAICLGEQVQLIGSNGPVIRWSPANSLSDSTIANPIARPVKTTVYSISVKDNSDCISTGSVTVTIKNAVVVKAGISGPDFVCRPRDTASFSSKSEGIINEWNWNFGNGQTSSLEVPQTVNFNINNNETIYNVILAVTDTAGCADIVHHILKIADNCYIAVPTAFTPNGDGKNDFLYPVNAYKARNLIFRVFNRNGQMVYQTRNWMQKWDGRINGLLQQTGVYVWYLEYTDGSNKRISLKGTTTLIR